MFPNDLSERLLKSIGVGVCLVDAGSNRVLFSNPTFAGWFPDASVNADMSRVVASLDADLLAQALEGKAIELEAKVKRRRLIVEVRVRQATHNGRDLLVIEGQNVSRLRETEAMIDSYAKMVDRRTRDLERQKEQVEKLLLNIMPRTVYEEYMTFGSVAPRLFEPVSVIMLDFVGFTERAAATDPNDTVAELNELFTAFDRISELYGCERIKTIGDCYLAVAGLPHPNPDHALSAARAAAKMMRYLERRNVTHRSQWQARVGIASGSVVGSVVGVQKYIYDVFGPAVNRAARLQALSEPMEITVCDTLTDDLVDDFVFDRQRTESVRGLGNVAVSVIKARESAYKAA